MAERKDRSIAEPLTFTGERIVPQADNCEPNFASRMFHEHLARYNFASQLTHGKRVLDVGCGVGYGSQRIAQLGAASVTAFDLSADAIRHAGLHYAHPAVEFSVGNAQSFSFERQFDIVLCFELIEHVENPERVLQCISRVLAPDGVLVMSTPRALAEKRTHFHVYEFTLDEYRSMLGKYFPDTHIYVENNHFVSIVTDGEPASIERVECLKRQFTLDLADTFISVSAKDPNNVPGQLVNVMVLDSDDYVTMLERDVGILHKAEDDLREKIDWITREHATQTDYFKGEIERLIGEYSGLFQRNENFVAQLHGALQQVAQLTAEREALSDRQSGLLKELGDAQGNASRLADEHDGLARRQDKLLEALGASRQDAIHCAKELDDLIQRQAILLDEFTCIQGLLGNCEMEGIQALAQRRQTMEWPRDASTGPELARPENPSLQDATVTDPDGNSGSGFGLLANIRGVVARLSALWGMQEDQIRHLAERLRDSEMTNARISEENEALKAAAAIAAARIADSEARRLEAFEFARRSNDTVEGLRRAHDLLKRDIQDALAGGLQGEAPAYAGHHRDIVEAMDRLFLGGEATHYVGRDPLVDQIGTLVAELREHREWAERAEAAAHAERERAEAAAHAERERAERAEAAAHAERERAERAEAAAHAERERAEAAAHAERERAERAEAAAHAELDRAEGDIHALQAQVNLAANDAQEQQERADALDAYVENRKAKIEEIRSSISWRLTKPVRGVEKVLGIGK